MTHTIQTVWDRLPLTAYLCRLSVNGVVIVGACPLCNARINDCLPPDVVCGVHAILLHIAVRLADVDTQLFADVCLVAQTECYFHFFFVDSFVWHSLSDACSLMSWENGMACDAVCLICLLFFFRSVCRCLSAACSCLFRNTVLVCCRCGCCRLCCLRQSPVPSFRQPPG